MGYKIVTVPASQRALKKLPKNIRKQLIKAAESLKDNPLLGEKLNHPFQNFRSFHIKHNNTQYRVVYEVQAKRKYIVIRYAASRENFYKELRRLNPKPIQD